MKKAILTLVVLVLVLGSLVGCSDSEPKVVTISAIPDNAAVTSAVLYANDWAEGDPIIITNEATEVGTTTATLRASVGLYDMFGWRYWLGILLVVVGSMSLGFSLSGWLRSRKPVKPTETE